MSSEDLTAGNRPGEPPMCTFLPKTYVPDEGLSSPGTSSDVEAEALRVWVEALSLSLSPSVSALGAHQPPRQACSRCSSLPRTLKEREHRWRVLGGGVADQ